MDTTNEPAPRPLGNGQYFTIYAFVALIQIDCLNRFVLKIKKCCRCCGCTAVQLLIVPSLLAFELGNILYKQIDAVQDQWQKVACRVVLWPFFCEVIMAPLRQKLRELDGAIVDKEGIALWLATTATNLTLIGTVISFSLRGYYEMMACNIGLAVMEIIARNRIGIRDKFSEIHK